jgi:hypothetical protein
MNEQRAKEVLDQTRRYLMFVNDIHCVEDIKDANLTDSEREIMDGINELLGDVPKEGGDGGS